MFLFSTLALSILQTFACDGLDINSFITWYDCRFVTPYILAESDTVTICSLSPLANLFKQQKRDISFWLPKELSLFFFHLSLNPNPKPNCHLV